MRVLAISQILREVGDLRRDYVQAVEKKGKLLDTADRCADKLPAPNGNGKDHAPERDYCMSDIFERDVPVLKKSPHARKKGVSP